MSGAVILLCLAMATARAEADSLVSQLGASRYADRETAAASLERLGRAAIPALKAARNHRDTEIRARSEALLVKIEGSLLLQPTMLTLDFHNQPVSEVVKQINAKSGVELLSLTDVRGPSASRLVTLEEPRAVPFWTAIDRLCDASGLQYTLGGQSNPMLRETSIRLSTGDARLAGLLSDHGPFRFNLLSLHYQRDLTFGVNPGQAIQAMQIGGAPPVATTTRFGAEQFSLRLQLAVEPQLSLSTIGTAKVVAATDDLGQSLVLPPAGGPMQVNNGIFRTNAGPTQFHVFLKRPEKPGRTIRSIKGVLPLSVSTRKTEALSIPLEGAVGKTFRNEDATLTIHDRKLPPGLNQTSVDLSIVAKVSRSMANEEIDAMMMMPRVDVSPLNLELLDDKGSPIPWFLSVSSQNGDELRLTLTIRRVDPSQSTNPKPVTLRYFGTIQSTAEIPFAFADVPMP